MATVIEIVRGLLQKGSNPGTINSVRDCPAWPPDLFAVAASLVQHSGCYSDPRFTAAWDTNGYYYLPPYREEVERVARRWAEEAVPPEELNKLWRSLLRLGNSSLLPERPSGGKNKNQADWEPIALRLLAIADEASAGMGFALDFSDNVTGSYFPYLLIEQHIELLKYETGVTRRKPALQLPYIPQSLCKMVSDQDACVQPKTNTPQVGCTLRSFSHNLALLPPRGVVSTSWLFAQSIDDGEEHRPLNVLLVPFPYVVHGSNFASDGSCIDKNNRYFSVDLGWIRQGKNYAKPEDMVYFICRLIDAARPEVGDIHAVVLPEGVLPDRFAERVATMLASRVPNLELFIAGTISQARGRPPRNSAFTCRFHRREILKGWYQSKHHRWCLERSQIPRYHLGHALDPDVNWWEKIDVDNRACVFSVVRPGASLAVLVCEDLARFDPVLPAINAVGPNLVIALLMDGPQLERRWPGRYATVLADDPGSSVLTLTCLGMVRRASMPGAHEGRQIALWKQPGGDARQLELAPGDHALALTLRTSMVEQFTFDGRSDRGTTRQFRLSAVRGVRVQRRHVPPWIELE